MLVGVTVDVLVGVTVGVFVLVGVTVGVLVFVGVAVGVAVGQGCIALQVEQSPTSVEVGVD